MYQGYLIKVNGEIFPNSMIRADTYTITPDQITDLDDYTDNDGEFHRNPLERTATKIEFNTPTMYERDMGIFYDVLPISPSHEKTSVDLEYYNPNSRSYKQAKVYMPDIQFPILQATDKNIMYGEIRLAFIEY